MVSRFFEAMESGAIARQETVEANYNLRPERGRNRVRDHYHHINTNDDGDESIADREQRSETSGYRH